MLAVPLAGCASGGTAGQETAAQTDVVANPGQDCLAHLFNWRSGQHVHDRVVTIGGNTSANSSSSGAAQLVQTAGSVINVSGGYMSYTPGFIQVSSLLTADGARVKASADKLPD